MPLQWSKVHIPLVHGIGEHIDERVRPATDDNALLSRAENCIFDRRGRLAKRYGFTALGMTVHPDHPAMDGPRVLMSSGDELLLMDRRRLYAYIPNEDEWHDRGVAPPATGAISVTFRDDASHQAGDMWYHDGYLGYLATRRFQEDFTATTLFEFQTVCRVASDDGNVVVNDVVLDESPVGPGSDPHSPHVTSTDDDLIFTWTSGTAPADLKAARWSTTDADPAEPTAIGTAIVDMAGTLFDERKYDTATDGTDWFCVYVSHPAFDLKASRRDDTGAALASSVDSSEDWHLVAITYDAVSGLLYGVAETQAGVLKLLSWTPSTMALASAITTINTPPAGYRHWNLGIVAHDGHLWVTWALTAVATNPPYIGVSLYADCRLQCKRALQSPFGAIGLETVDVPNVMPTTAPWVEGGRVYIACESMVSQDVNKDTAPTIYRDAGVSARFFEACCVLDLTGADTIYDQSPAEPPFGSQPALVGVHSVGVGPTVEQRRGSANHVTSPQAGRWRYMSGQMLYSNFVYRNDVTERMGQNEVELRFDEHGLWSRSGAGALAIGGSFVGWYDGAELTELSYIYPPIITDIDETGTVATATYGAGDVVGYLPLWESYDALGILHRSYPGVPVQWTVVGTSPIALQVVARTLGPTNRRDEEVGLVYYRQKDGSGVYGRLNDPAHVIENDRSARVTDVITDRDQPVGPAIYITGGVLEDVCPEGARVPRFVGGRLWLGDFFTRARVQFSKPPTPGSAAETELAPGFNEAFGYVLRSGRRVTGVAELDDKVVVFTEGEIYLVAGQGPDDTGAANDFSGLQLVSNDVGCIEPRSVVSTPDGVMFQAPAGIYLLDRSHQVRFIGERIEDTTDTFPIISDAELYPEETLVVFCVDNPVSRNGAILAYDYRVGEWTQWTVRRAGGQVRPTSVVRHRGELYILTNDGVVMQWDRSTWLDDGADFIPMTITSSWVQSAIQGGWQRVRKVSALCARKDDHDLTMALRQDFEGSASQSHTWTEAVIDTFPDPARRLEVTARTRRQKCLALQVELSDAASAGTVTGRGYTLAGFTLEIGAKRGLHKPDPAQRI